MKKFLLFLCFLLMIGLSGNAYALSVTYTEVLDDIDDSGLLNDDGILLDVGRDLVRTRTFGDGTMDVEDIDATIILENNLITSNFGLSTRDPIIYSHHFIDIPPVEEFSLAKLTISAFSVSGTPTNVWELLFGMGPIPDDPVIGDFIGFLEPGGPTVETLTEFSTTDSVLIELFLADDMLNVGILPSGPGLFTLPDHVAVRTSTLEVEYVPIPEPATFLLLGTGLLGLAGGLRRKLKK